MRGIAARLGITLVPLAMDAEGVCPDALLRAHRATPLSGVYLQPTLQNPLGATMVSSEGACAAYYTYRRLELVETS